MEDSLRQIQDRIAKKDFRYSEHAVKRMIQRAIEPYEIEEAIANGEIIEEYPKDKYSPSCLIYGLTKAKRKLHIAGIISAECCNYHGL